MASRHSERARSAAASLMGEPSPSTLRRLERLDEQISRRPESRLFVQKGKALESLLKFGPALTCYNRALAEAPGSMPALLAKASLLERSSRGPQAVKVLELAIAVGGRRAELSFEQGRILHEIGRPERAIPYYQRCLSLKRHHAKAATNLMAALIAVKRYNEAVALAEAELAHNPQWVAILISRGVARIELKQYAESMQDYAAALSLSPDNQTVFYNMACWWMKKGKAGKALSFLDKAMEGRGTFAVEARRDPTFRPLQAKLRFWQITLKGGYLDAPEIWHLCKKFHVTPARLERLMSWPRAAR